MKLTTSKGKEYDVLWAFGPTIKSGKVMFEMWDSRPLAQIASEFDGLKWLKRESKNEGDATYEGYGVLASIQRTDGNTVMIGLSKG